jgi:hypothetical protein
MAIAVNVTSAKTTIAAAPMASGNVGDANGDRL